MLRGLKGLYHLLVAILANIWFGFPSRKLTVVGVTGTDGKTTTTTLIYEILRKSGVKASMITSVHAVIAGHEYDTGFHVTTPTAWWVQKYLREAVNHGDTHMVLEVTSHALSQSRVFGVQFAVGVITNVTHEHLDWHGTFEHYLRTKMKLLRQAKVAVVNRDEANVYMAIVPSVSGRKRYITYGIRRDSMVNPKTFPFKTQLPGEFNRYNTLAALAAASALGIDQDKAASAVAGFRGIPGRMELIAEKPFKIIVDFAHTPNALLKALAAAREMTRGRLIHVFGSAGLRDRTKRPLMGKASSSLSDVIVLTEEDYRTEDVNAIMDAIAKGIKGRETHRYPNRLEAITYALSIAKAGDTVIVTGKGHEKSLCRGKTEYPWSDQEEIKKLLRKRA